MEILDRSIQKTHIWIKDAEEALNWRDQRKAYTAIRAVLHALRDRITNEEVVQLGAQLPTFIRGVYYEGWKVAAKPVRDSTKYGFLAAIQKPFGKDKASTIDTIHVARAIFRVLNQKISQGEIDDIRAILPKPIGEFWPDKPKARKRKLGPAASKAKSGRRKQEHTVRELLQAANKGGRAVTGLARTMQPLNEGRVWEILYDPSAPLRGYACSTCASLFATDRDSCSYCGSPLHEVSDMSARIVEFASERGIRTEAVFGADSTLLTRSAGSIGAFLRTSRASKLGLA